MMLKFFVNDSLLKDYDVVLLSPIKRVEKKKIVRDTIATQLNNGGFNITNLKGQFVLHVEYRGVTFERVLKLSSEMKYGGVLYYSIVTQRSNLVKKYENKHNRFEFCDPRETPYLMKLNEDGLGENYSYWFYERLPECFDERPSFAKTCPFDMDVNEILNSPKRKN